MQREAKAVNVHHYKAEEADRKLCDGADAGSQKTSIKLSLLFSALSLLSPKSRGLAIPLEVRQEAMWYWVFSYMSSQNCDFTQGLLQGPEEMTHQLRALPGSVEDLSSVPSTHMAPHNFLELQIQGTRDTLFWLLQACALMCTHRHMYIIYSPQLTL